jgi:two-component sensor histidine kinase
VVLREALREKELLIREIHHRVKNNLQVISSLLSLQGRASMSPGGQRACEESQLRIKSIALVHELLYRSDNMTRIEAEEYLRRLGTKLLSTFSLGERVAFTVEGCEAYVDLDHAVPFGLVVNELMTNAMKHAFPGGRRGTITVFLMRVEGERLQLDFRDDGVGLSEAIDPLASTSLGFRLIGSLVQQLDGRYSFPRGEGTRCLIDFPVGRSS